MLEAIANGKSFEDVTQPADTSDAGQKGADAPASEVTPTQEEPKDAAEQAKPEAQAETPKADGEPEQVQKLDKEPDDLSDENAVVLGKNGKYTIPYASLEKARTDASESKQKASELARQLEDAQRELDELKRQAQARAESGQAPTKVDNMAAAAQQAIDQGVNPEIFGDFSPEDLAKGVTQLVAAQLGQARQQVLAEVKQAIQPVLNTQHMTEAEAHRATILAAHADAAAIAESKELADWIKAQPGYAQSGIVHAIQQGSASEVIDVLNAFKRDTQPAQAKEEPAKASAPTLTPEQVKAKAKEAEAKSDAGTAPVSLSDVAGGRANGVTSEEAFRNKHPMAMVQELMAKGGPEKINEYLSRAL